METDRSRSQILLDIEHDLSRIKNRLNALEDQFEDGGLIDQIAQSVHQIAIKLEQLTQARDADR